MRLRICIAGARRALKEAIYPGGRPSVPLKSITLAFCCLLLVAERAQALIDAELASGDIARAVVGIVGPHNSFCTATAIAHDVLLTAAHCVQPGSNYKAQYKEANGLRQFSDAADFERAPQYTPGTPTTPPIADLALIKLVNPLPSSIDVASLGLSGPPVWPGDRFTVIGGGIPFRGLHETGINREASLVAAAPYTSLQIRLVELVCQGGDVGRLFWRLRIPGVPSPARWHQSGWCGELGNRPQQDQGLRWYNRRNALVALPSVDRRDDE